MLSKQEFLTILKKSYQKYFTTKQAIDALIMEKYDVDYVDLKYKNGNLSSIVKQTRRTVHTLLRDMEKTQMIEKYSIKTWRFN